MLYRMKLMGRTKPTHAVLSSAMMKLLCQNAQVRAHLPGNTTGLSNLGQVVWNADGTLKSLCGVQLIEHYMTYDDWNTGMTGMDRRYMWPVNKVTFFSLSNPEIPEAKLGYSVLTLGENPFGQPGVYVRTAGTEQLVDPTLPAGLVMQVGMAGLPALWKPWWVHVVTACDESDIISDVGGKYINAN